MAELSNELPQFQADLKPVLEIKVLVDDVGEIQEPDQFIYVSPPAKDPEGHDIKMTFSGFEGLVWATMRANDDGTFKFKVQKSLVAPEDAGEYTMTITLGDSVQA